MKIIRFHNKKTPFWGIYNDGGIVNIIENTPYSELQISQSSVSINAQDFIAPCEPSKVVGLAYNYKDLVGKQKDFDEPLIFFKSPTSVIGPNDSIVIPSKVDTVWVEVELAFVVKKVAKNITVSNAPDFILGYTIANDVTAQNVAGRDWHLARSKGLDTFCPVGPALITDIDTSSLELITTINGKITQHSNTVNRIYNDYEALSFISHFITLYPGDLVLTGTPAGALESTINPSDTISLEIEGIGKLTNSIKKRGDFLDDRNSISHR